MIYIDKYYNRCEIKNQYVSDIPEIDMITISDIFKENDYYLSIIELDTAKEKHYNNSNIVDSGIHAVNININKFIVMVDMF